MKFQIKHIQNKIKIRSKNRNKNDKIIYNNQMTKGERHNAGTHKGERRNGERLNGKSHNGENF